MKVRLLSEADIFDVYGCEYLLTLAKHKLDTAETFTAVSRLNDIHLIYVNSVKERIRAEARFLGVDIGDGLISIESMLHKVRDIIQAKLKAPSMTGNVMQTILQAHMMAGNKLEGINVSQFGVKRQEPPKDPGVDPQWFLKRERGTHIWDDVKWHEIAKAFVRLESAKIPTDITSAIDYLNTLQHNSFHLLIDLQNGRMLNGVSTGELYGNYEKSRMNVQLVLDLVKKSSYPYDFRDKMSGEIRKLVHKHGRV